MYNQNKVSAIIVSYKDGALIDDCLETLQKQYENLEIIIKNQESETSIETFHRISSKYPSVEIINGPNNGLSGGLNECAKIATGNYLLFIGADIRFKNSTIQGLVEYLNSNPEVGGVTGELRLADGSIDMDAHRAFPTPWISFTRLFGLQKMFPNSTLFNGYFLPGKDMGKPHEIDMCITHFMMVPKSVYTEVGGFDEAFFLYGEDVDFCYRIKERGYKIIYAPQFQITHLKGGSVGIRKTTRKLANRPLHHRIKMQRHSTNAMVIFLKKHYFKKYSAGYAYLMIFTVRVLGVIRVIMELTRR